MIVNYLALLIALFLSVVAAYYSIVGLAVIFASAMLPVVVMASALEAGKVVATSWLYRNWHHAPKFIKYYLTVAVIVLMFITSMGIFGFLSKAHLEQAVIGGDSSSKLALYDEKIKTAKDNIDANRKALKQLDEAVDQVMARSTDEKGADKAVAIRRGQTKERARLLQDIEAEQKVIAKLSEERAPIAAEVRKVEAEVGPIKYIAALIYGDNPDENVLEKAVRFVIISLVMVFDPLAIMLLLAANYSLYRNETEAPSSETEPVQVVVPEPEPERPTRKTRKKKAEQPAVEPIPQPEPEPEPESDPEPWSPRWAKRAGVLIEKKKQGIIEIDKDSIVNMK